MVNFVTSTHKKVFFIGTRPTFIKFNLDISKEAMEVLIFI